MNKTIATFALAVMIVFLGILLYWVPRIDLSIVVLITFGLAAFDIWNQVWRRRGS